LEQCGGVSFAAMERAVEGYRDSLKRV